MSSSRAIPLPRFRLSSLLLAMLVVATICDVFLRPQLTNRTFGEWSIESNLVLPPKPSGAAVPTETVEHGRWSLLDRAGRRVIDGYREYGTPTGHWRFYDAQGSVTSEGQVQGYQFVGPWTGTSDNGVTKYEVDFGPATALSLPIKSRPTKRPPTSDAVKRTAKMASADELERWQKQLASDRFMDRNAAMQEMAEYGPSVLPVLLAMVEDVEHRARAPALHLIKCLGEEAQPAAERLRRCLEQAEGADAIPLLATLVVIDAPKRPEHVHRLLEWVAVEKALAPSELYWMLVSPYGFFMEGLSSGVADERVAVRRLTAGLLNVALGLYTSNKRLDPFEFEDMDEFRLGLSGQLLSYRYSETVDDVERYRRRDVIVPLLQVMARDANSEIRKNVAKYL